MSFLRLAQKMWCGNVQIRNVHRQLHDFFFACCIFYVSHVLGEILGARYSYVLYEHTLECVRVAKMPLDSGEIRQDNFQFARRRVEMRRKNSPGAGNTQKWANVNAYDTYRTYSLISAFSPHTMPTFATLFCKEYVKVTHRFSAVVWFLHTISLFVGPLCKTNITINISYNQLTSSANIFFH